MPILLFVSPTCRLHENEGLRLRFFQTRSLRRGRSRVQPPLRLPRCQAVKHEPRTGPTRRPHTPRLLPLHRGGHRGTLSLFGCRGSRAYSALAGEPHDSRNRRRQNRLRPRLRACARGASRLRREAGPRTPARLALAVAGNAGSRQLRIIAFQEIWSRAALQ